jgi:predicted O-methyltransferase YrrM
MGVDLTSSITNFFLSLCICSSGFAAITGNPRDYLLNKIPPGNCRYVTMQYALQLMEERNAQTIVETGTARYGTRYFDSDGGSTIIFSEWARDHQAEFYSIDLSSMNLSAAKDAVALYVSDYPDNIHYICSDSIAYLGTFNRPIDFLYLDSFDYELDDPVPSQQHHLKEIKAVYPFLTDTTIIMIDDCDLPGGGKGKLVIEYLLERGWKIVKNHYQVILTRSHES